jgi:glycosyltransferase involved in cell wall biosynthesis
VIVIPTHRRPDLLERTLASLAGCNLPPSFSQTIVIENGPPAGADRVVAAAAPCLRIRYLYQASGNKSLALNTVLKEIDNALVVFFDDDVRIEPDTLMAYDRHARDVSAGVFYGGAMGVDYQKGPPPKWLSPFLPASLLGWSLEPDTDVVNRAVFLGCNWAAYSEDLRRCGGFNTAVGPGSPTRSTGQERDMQERLLQAGLRGRYVADAKVWHYVTAAECTPAYALQRAFRHAVEGGLRFEDHSPHLLGIPRWLVRRLMLSYLRALCVSLFRPEPLRFKAWYDHVVLRGLARGYRIARGQMQGIQSS